MARKIKKMWLVKREVLATSVATAVHAKGRVYEVAEAGKEYQPEIKVPKLGFKNK